MFSRLPTTACRCALVFQLLFVGILEAAPPGVPLANVYQQGMSLEGYWVSEKYDGVRAYWDGSRLLSRRGNVFHAPDWFTRDLPDHPLDGELWMGRERFAELSGAVRRLEPLDSEWREIRFMVFDRPRDDRPFSERLQALRAEVSDAGLDHLVLVDQRAATDHQQLMQQLDEIIARGGEGLMLKHGDSLYRAGRSRDLLKVKRFQDAEAVVLGHLPGKGRLRGKMGALLVELDSGRKLRIGTGFTDEERDDPPPEGSVITFRYSGHTSTGLPRFASYVRIRDDEPAVSVAESD